MDSYPTLMTTTNETRAKGFGPRFLATWIDCLLIYTILKLVDYLLFSVSLFIYFPFPFTFFLTGMAYSMVMVASRGETAGKYLLNLKVCDNSGEKLSLAKSVLRESVFKLLSGVFFCLGFLWICFSGKKKGWHDYLSGSTVIINLRSPKRSFVWQIAASTSFIIMGSSYLWNIGSVIYLKNRINSCYTTTDELPFVHRNPSATRETAAITDVEPYLNWVSVHAEDPKSYAVKMARQHQLVLFGEMHDNRDNLLFFNRIIKDLYYHAGVRCIGMEVIPAYMNEKVQKLINAKVYDENLALEIARSQPWKIWGDKEYWDVLRTVWKLNLNQPDSSRMQVIGLEADYVFDNIVLLNISGEKKGATPFYEKFRAPAAISDFANASDRDAFILSVIEREMLQKNKKGVIWVGATHAYPYYGYPIIKNGRIVSTYRRMGALLQEKYKNRVFQILMNNDLLARTVKSGDSVGLADFFESVMAKNRNVPVGFTVKNSPFEFIRDQYTEPFNFYPSIRLGDLAQGIIFLKPRSKLKQCTWTEGFVSNRMFMEYKPLYEAISGKHFDNAQEVNVYFKSQLSK